MIDMTQVASRLRARLNLDSASLLVQSFYGSTMAHRRMTMHELQVLIVVDGTTYTARVQLAGHVPTMADIIEAIHDVTEDAKQNDCPCCGPSNAWPAWADLDKEIVHGL